MRSIRARKPRAKSWHNFTNDLVWEWDNKLWVLFARDRGINSLPSCFWMCELEDEATGTLAITNGKLHQYPSYAPLPKPVLAKLTEYILLGMNRIIA